MGLAERIARRRVNSTAEDLVADWEKLDPSIHLDEPVGRGSVLEQILDTMGLFRSELPSNLAVWGPRARQVRHRHLPAVDAHRRVHGSAFAPLHGDTWWRDARPRPVAYADARRAPS